MGVWLLAVRPKTLTAALIPILVGTSLAYAIHGEIRAVLSIFAFLSAVFIQIGTNLINDSLDFKKGADTSERIGPQRVTQSGLLSPEKVLWGGLICFIISILFSIPLVIAGGWSIILIGMFSLLAGYAYTGGPYPLAYVGLGDLFVLVFFGWVAVGGVYFLNTGALDTYAMIAGTQVGLLATVLISINNLRDHVTDRLANKKTLAVRLGPERVRWEIVSLCLIPFLLGGFWFRQGMMWAGMLPFLVFPLAIVLIQRIRNTEPSPAYNGFLAQGALLQMVFGILLSLGLMIR